ncbi:MULTISPECIES: hypothetical protein [Methylomonas]|uniref:hypothetical protein n=1 Tax=Methylomonas TaxID=416 RepID=UPI001232851D|nr:hypothetical protein [Methylomonas rhizoryzae]
MKSVKKRFKQWLIHVDQAARELDLLVNGLSQFQDMTDCVRRILVICEKLRECAAQIDKLEFAERMRFDPLIDELDGMVDNDVMSSLEARLCDLSAEGEAGVLLGELLDKIEKQHAALLCLIQQAGGLLAEEGAAGDV